MLGLFRYRGVKFWPHWKAHTLDVDLPFLPVMHLPVPTICGFRERFILHHDILQSAAPNEGPHFTAKKVQHRALEHRTSWPYHLHYHLQVAGQNLLTTQLQSQLKANTLKRMQFRLTGTAYALSQRPL